MSRPASYDDGHPPVNDEVTLFDLFFDLPHPAASTMNERSRMIEPPEIHNPAMLAEMYEPSNISRIARFAFPCHDDQEYAANLTFMSAMKDATGDDNGVEGNLNRFDFYLQEFSSTQHTFALQLSDGITRLHGHVLRYLPPRRDAKARSDVGRRGARAMVILTRATGGDRFFTAVLRTVESVMTEGDGIAAPDDWEDRSQDRARSFLHELHRKHSLYTQEKNSQLRLKGAASLTNDDTILSIPGVEYGCGQGFGRNRRRDPNRLDGILPGDFLKYQLPRSLQAGFYVGGMPEDIDSPILPILRCLGSQNTMRLLSGLLCERRIIFVSKSITRLSACSRAASAILAQGLLSWQFIHIPVLPPHLLKYLASETPYVVGLLERYIIDVEHVPGLRDVLCIHLDKNQLRTFNMATPSQLVPDMLSRTNTKISKKSSESVGIAELLANDIDQILRAEKKIWGNMELQKRLSNGSEHEDMDQWNVGGRKPDSFRMRNRNGSWTGANTNMGGNHLPTLFGQVMRGDTLVGELESSNHMLSNSSEHSSMGDDSQSRRTNTIRADTLTTFDICDNERGEEEIRAALVSFFLVMYGDLGTILSEDPRDGSLWLDRKKYLLYKRKEGHNVQMPMFALYKSFSGSTMLECYLQEKIAEFERNGELLIPRHRPLYALCETHIRSKGIEFTVPNVRRVVSKTVLGLPTHTIVEKCELSRARALALTSTQPFDGNISHALSTLMNECRECNGSLTQVIAVVWSRLDDPKATQWKHPLLALHLLKNLLLHGPITAVALSLDGVDKIRNLRGYSAGKSIENKTEIRNSAKQVYELLIDRRRLFLRRNRAVAVRAKLVDTKREGSWGDYLVRRLPFTAGFKQFHMLVRPSKDTKPCFMSKQEFQATREKEKSGQEKRLFQDDSDDETEDTEVTKSLEMQGRNPRKPKSSTKKELEFPGYLNGRRRSSGDSKVNSPGGGMGSSHSRATDVSDDVSVFSYATFAEASQAPSRVNGSNGTHGHRGGGFNSNSSRASNMDMSDDGSVFSYNTFADASHAVADGASVSGSVTSRNSRYMDNSDASLTDSGSRRTAKYMGDDASTSGYSTGTNGSRIRRKEDGSARNRRSRDHRKSHGTSRRHSGANLPQMPLIEEDSSGSIQEDTSVSSRPQPEKGTSASSSDPTLIQNGVSSRRSRQSTNRRSPVANHQPSPSGGRSTSSHQNGNGTLPRVPEKSSMNHTTDTLGQYKSHATRSRAPQGEQHRESQGRGGSERPLRKPLR